MTPTPSIERPAPPPPPPTVDVLHLVASMDDCRRRMARLLAVSIVRVR